MLAGLNQAIEIAQNQGAVFLTLKAAVDLCQTELNKGDGSSWTVLEASIDAMTDSNGAPILKRAEEFLSKRPSTRPASVGD